MAPLGRSSGSGLSPVCLPIRSVADRTVALTTSDCSLVGNGPSRRRVRGGIPVMPRSSARPGHPTSLLCICVTITMLCRCTPKRIFRHCIVAVPQRQAFWVGKSIRREGPGAGGGINAAGKRQRKRRITTGAEEKLKSDDCLIYASPVDRRLSRVSSHRIACCRALLQGDAPFRLWLLGAGCGGGRMMPCR